ncbi:hypothetical protein BT67DRAFT_440999 [Trichocladium antarcticum]|uniref:Myb-like domain-containing protein n=1 Tax=Trichocladium antarcticum TaxID=1450529 RepID=A0AAN6UMC7_9PEZI|nr:hypothetical protein BT67DRAFT_440999 [Trichocladium antarcticum]
MLNKKSAFKPKAKAAVRRPAPGSGSQSSQRPSPAEPLVRTPAAAPQESSSSSQSLPAPHSVPGTPVDIGTSASSDGPAKNIEPAPGVSEQIQVAAVEPAPQDTTSSTPAVVVTEAPPATVPTATPNAEPLVSVQPEQPVSVGEAAVEESGLSNTPVINIESAPKDQPTAVTIPATAPSPPRLSDRSTSSLTDIASLAPTPSATPTPAPTPIATQPSPGGATLPAVVSGEPAQSTTEATFEPVPEPSGAAKPKRDRKRKPDATSADASGEQRSTAAPRKRARIRAAPLPGEEGYQPRQTASRATRAQKRSRSTTTNGETEEDGEGNTGAKRRPPRPQREATPEDAETVEIDVTQVKMADLAKDMRVGKKFSLHDELMERERAKRLRYNEKRKRQQTGDGDDDAAEDGGNSAAAPSSNANSSAQDTPANAAADDTPATTNQLAPIGEQYQIIDGEIVLDHRSLEVDRHARAREAAGELVEVEENDFTHHTTSATYLRRNLKPQQWSDDETDLFYNALSAFGTDFDTICRMFKTKTRKHIKLKFNREERVNPQRINAALVGQKTVAMSMDEYQRHTGQEYESAEAIYAEQKRAEDEFEARQKALEDEKADEVRRKKEELLARLNSSVEGENAGGGDGGRKGGRKGPRKKKTNFVGL